MSQELASYPSKSNPSKAYKVLLGGDGNVYCECAAWRFQKGKGPQGRRCKHLDDYWHKENLRAQKILPQTVWEKLTSELFDVTEPVIASPPKRRRKVKGKPGTVWDRLEEEEEEET